MKIPGVRHGRQAASGGQGSAVEPARLAPCSESSSRSLDSASSEADLLSGALGGPGTAQPGRPRQRSAGRRTVSQPGPGRALFGAETGVTQAGPLSPPRRPRTNGSKSPGPFHVPTSPQRWSCCLGPVPERPFLGERQGFSCAQLRGGSISSCAVPHQLGRRPGLHLLVGGVRHKLSLLFKGL